MLFNIVRFNCLPKVHERCEIYIANTQGFTKVEGVEESSIVPKSLHQKTKKYKHLYFNLCVASMQILPVREVMAC